MNTLIQKAAFFLILTIPSLAAMAETPRIGMEANTSFWWTIYEQVENGLRQSGSGESAAAQASGFNFKQGRVALTFASPDEKVEALVRIRLEERTDVIDFWGAYRAAPWLTLSVGQMKIPSTAEVLTRDHALDFISRTTFGRRVGDYSLVRTPYISSTMAVKSYNRDLGMALKGTLLPDGRTSFNYFLMIGNGIGANKYIGGRESEGYLFTNRFGDFYYGLRCEVDIHERLTVGLHGSLNTHDDVALTDRGPVYDIDRKVWTVDCTTYLPWDQSVYAFYGMGDMNDFIEAQTYTFDYNGWGIWSLKTFLGGRIEAGLRYDAFTSEFNSNGNETTQKNWTFGLNCRLESYLRLQFNYLDKLTVNEFEPDIDDNIFYLNAQFLFSGMLID
jgi:hypothetical protein